MLETETHCIADEDKGQYVTDTGNKFTECQAPRKKLQLISILSVSLNAGPQHSRMKEHRSTYTKVSKGVHKQKLCILQKPL